MAITEWVTHDSTSCNLIYRRTIFAKLDSVANAKFMAFAVLGLLLLNCRDTLFHRLLKRLLVPKESLHKKKLFSQIDTRFNSCNFHNSDILHAVHKFPCHLTLELLFFHFRTFFYTSSSSAPTFVVYGSEKKIVYIFTDVSYLSDFFSK